MGNHIPQSISLFRERNLSHAHTVQKVSTSKNISLSTNEFILENDPTTVKFVTRPSRKPIVYGYTRRFI
jgi:hypothetical protein